MIITLQIITTKEIKDIEDKIAGRIYSMEGIDDVTVLEVYENYKRVEQPNRSDK